MKLLRIGLCLLVAFSVLSFGAVEVWSQSVLEIVTAVLFVFWAILVYRCPGSAIAWNPVTWPVLGLIAIGLLQLMFHGTAYPFLTRTELLKLLSYLLIAFLAAQAFRTRAELSRLAWFIVVLCFTISLLGIIQHFTSGGTIYWVQEFKTEGDPFGPFVNRNHFSGFVELTLPMGLAMMAFRGVKRDLFPLTTLLTIVPISAVVLTGSRGGIISLAFEVGVLVLLVRSRHGLSWRSPRTIAFGAVALVALALIAWVGAGRAIERLSKLNPHEVTLNRRFSMARGAAHIFLHHPVKGCGLGTLVGIRSTRRSTTASLSITSTTITWSYWLKRGFWAGCAAQLFCGCFIGKREGVSGRNRVTFRAACTPGRSLRLADYCSTAWWISTCISLPMLSSLCCKPLLQHRRRCKIVLRRSNPIRTIRSRMLGPPGYRLGIGFSHR
jgi:hypothetical protein